MYFLYKNEYIILNLLKGEENTSFPMKPIVWVELGHRAWVLKPNQGLG
jgi:hypothetical protein